MTKGILQPKYYERFHCLASACPDSCCQEWEVDLDDAAAARYRAMPGPLGETLRAHLRQGEEGAYLALENGRCPMWQEDGLCRLHREAGEEALCQVCREFPRWSRDYGDLAVRGLELSCPEAARLILAADPGEKPEMLQEQGEPDGSVDEGTKLLLVLFGAQMNQILLDEGVDFGEALAAALVSASQMETCLNGGNFTFPEAEKALATAKAWAQPGDMGEILGYFSGLEILTERWRARLANPTPAQWTRGHRALARYFLDRYWYDALSDGEVYRRVKFLVVACLVVRHLGGDLTATAQLFAKEIESSPENLAALMEAMTTERAFTDTKLFGLLL